MKAFTRSAPGAPPSLRDDVPVPVPGDGEVLVHVRASSVNPVDAGIAAGALEGRLEHTFPVTLGRDYAGTVEAVGAGVTGYAPGDEVFGFVGLAAPTVHAGSWAERIVVPEAASIARRPSGVDLATAGAAPLAGITALLAIDALGLADGATVLVLGAAGGVGTFAVQLAARAGATVLAPALPEDEAPLRALGVTAVLARDGDVAAAVRERHPDGVDALLDLVSHTPGGFDDVLAPGARVASPNHVAGDGPGRTNVMAVPSTENLDRLGALLADGGLDVPIQATYDLEQAGEALRALGAEHTRGKLALRVG